MLVNTHILKSKLLTVVFLLVLIQSHRAQVLTLKQCTDTALLYNKSLKLAQGEQLMSLEKSKEIKGGLLPKLYANADYKYSTNLPYQLMPASTFGGPADAYREIQFGTPQNLNAGLSLEIPLFNAQANGAVAVSKYAQEMTLLQYQQTEEQVIFEVANLYYNAQIVMANSTFINSGILNNEKLLSTMRLLQSQQMAKTTDVDKVLLQQSQLSTQLTILSAQYTQIINLLKLQIGYNLEQNIEIEKLEPEMLNNSVYVTKQTSEMLLQQTKQKLISSELNTLRYTRIPSFSLFGNYGTNGFGDYSGTNDFFKFYPVGFAGIKMSWLLFSGNSLTHKIAQKKQELNQNTIRAEILKDKQTIQVANAQLQLSTAVSNLSNSKKQLVLAEQIYTATLLQQKEGVANLTEVLLSDAAQKEAQQNYLSAWVALMKLDLEFKKISGNILNKN